MRQARRALTPQQQLEAAEALYYRFRTSPLFLSRHRIGIYLANDGEIDPIFLSQSLLKLNKSLFLPCLDPLGVNRLSFSPFKSNTTLRPNKYGILEPVWHKKISATSLDLVFLPLVAFDRTGNRLGMGGGFYDRTFAFKRQANKLGPKLVGLAHECQKIDRLEAQNWDIPLDAILTNQQYMELTALD